MIVLMLLILTLVCFSGLKALALEGEGPFARLQLELISSAYAHGDERHVKREPQDLMPRAASAATDSDAETAQPADTARPAAPPQQEGQSFWATAHKVLVNVMLWLIGGHLLGVTLSSALHRENLVRAMITGYKPQRRK